MATHAEISRFLTGEETKRPISGLGFDWLMVGLSIWFIAGLFIDGWAHGNGRTDDTFFTPWHAVLYSGFMVVSLALVSVIIINRRRGQEWSRAIPKGYALSLLGVGIFAVGGVFDMIWHILFGIENNTEAVLSPSHLLLATGFMLILSGPLRAAWGRVTTIEGQVERWSNMLPMLMSLTFILSILTFFTEYANPLVIPYALRFSADRFTQNANVTLGVDSFIIYTVILMSVTFFVMRRWRLPFGSLMFLFSINAALISVLGRYAVLNLLFYVPVWLLTGLVADLMLRYAKPSPENPKALRVFAFVIPLILYFGYFLALMIMAPIRFSGMAMLWSVHLWAGSVVLAGIVGLLLSFLVAPPALPQQSKSS